MLPSILLAAGILWLLLLWGVKARPLAADLLAGGALFLLTLGFFWRTLSGDVFQPADGGDLASFLFPTYRFAARSLAEGSLPLWNPHLYAGAPFLGDIQAGFLYLPNLLLFLLWPEFPYTALQWMAALHVFWAGLGTYVLLRTLRFGGRQVHAAAALFGALAFAFCDPLLMHLGNLNLIAVLAWLPWILAALERGLAGRSLRWVAAAGLLYGASIYAGHAQATVLVGLGMGLFALGRGLAGTSAWRWAAGAPLLAGLLAALLAAPILLPALELAQQTARAEFTYQQSVDYSLAPAQLIGLLTPGFFGRGPALHWSLWQRVELPYVGVAALVMALAALLLARESATRRALMPWIGMALAGLLVGLGIYAIAHGWLALMLPYFGSLRAPARALVLWAMGAAVLAGAGLDLTMRRAAETVTLARLRPALLPAHDPLRAVLRAGTLILFGVVLPLLYLSLLLTQESETAFLRASLALLALALAAGFWLGTWLLVEAARSGWIGPRAFGILVVALLFVDLSATGAYTDISPDNPTAKFEHPEIVEFLKNDPSVFRIDTLTDIDGLWQPDTAALHGLDDVGGIDNPLMLEAWRDYWESTGGRDTDAYNALNVKYVIARDGTPFPNTLTPVFDAPGELAVWENTTAWPRAWLAAVAAWEPDAGALPVAVAQVGPNRMSLRVEAAQPARLVVSLVAYPGWRATVDGQPATLLAGNGAFLRGIDLTAGEHTVELTYAPASLRDGLWAAATGALILVALLWLGRRSQNRSRTS